MKATSYLKSMDADMNESLTPKKEVITIKKYANRRLYNTATSSYVTLANLAEMIKEGVEFNVYDAKTSEDITRSVLTQIIVEEEGRSGQNNLLPINFLRQLISFYGGSMQWLVPKYLEHSMQILANNQEQLTNYFHAAFGNMFPFSSALEEISKQNMAMLEKTIRFFSPFMPADKETENEAFSESVEQKPSKKVFVEPVEGTKDEATPENKEKETEVRTAAVCQITESEKRIMEPTKPATTPMPNVQTAKASSQTGIDDMQQKIANLQRQLAELAKKGA